MPDSGKKVFVAWLGGKKKIKLNESPLGKINQPQPSLSFFKHAKMEINKQQQPIATTKTGNHKPPKPTVCPEEISSKNLEFEKI